MISSQKFDFLMNITNTSNNSLANFISYDPSHISRLRYGQRNIPQKTKFLLPVSEYFAGKIKTEFQIKSLKKSLGIKKDQPFENNRLTEYIYNWLSEKTAEPSHPVEKFLKDFSKAQLEKILPKECVDILNLPIEETDVSFYYGINGKREAVKKLFSLVKQELDPQTLLLFSDEETNWISGNINFVKKWSSFLEQIILDGNKLNVIHTATNTLDEKFSTISKWIPLYITGAIEPYFYPKQRDQIYKRTLFIAPLTAAVTFSSVKSKAQNVLSLLITDKMAVKTLEQEYHNYLELCEPFIYIFTPQKRDSFEEFLTAFEETEGDCITSSAYFSPTVLSIKKNPDKTLKNSNYIEILSLPGIEALKTNNIFELPIDICCDGPYQFTKEQYTEHLKEILVFLNKYENYNVVLNINTNENCIIYSKKDIGTIITRKSIPSVIFAIKEIEMTNLFREYLIDVQIDSQIQDREEVIKKIKEAIRILES
ncbi:hypothetical protein LJC10_03130 [Selenomonadales bacterium OttesenSCG-928-I06]|nr:hypothetical protein [Selenomonadales bacterium OttesenSCG-928-I06]